MGKDVKKIITEGVMIKGGINRQEKSERPKNSPPPINFKNVDKPKK